VMQMMMFVSFLIVFWRVMVLFQLPHEHLAPLRVARLCRAKHCNCNCNCNLPFVLCDRQVTVVCPQVLTVCLCRCLWTTSTAF
jgi:hypothetical protein